MTIAVGEFKAKCLRIMDEVQATRSPVTITKRGKPVAVLTPYPEENPAPLFGRLKGRVRMADALIEPTGLSWEAEQCDNVHLSVER
jgi:prevent-host-death family protein